SVTSILHSRRSHSSLCSQIRFSSARISSSGTDQSTSSSTTPSSCRSVLVQFSNGLLAKYEVGRIKRRSSQIFTTTCRSVISSMVPQCPSTTTTSSSRNASENATCRPAKKLPSIDWAARDRKSTRLNSSHVKISYAVFCLKK